MPITRFHVAVLPFLGAVCLSFTLLAIPPTPTRFRVQADASRNKATLSWSSSANQIRFFIQKQLPNGTWTPVSGFPVNQLNNVKFTYDTPATTTGTFRFWIKAKVGSLYSDTTPKIVLTNMH